MKLLSLLLSLKSLQIPAYLSTQKARDNSTVDFIQRVKNPVSSLVVTGLINGTNFLLLVIVGRYQGNEALGKFTFVLGVMTILSYVTDFGFSYLIQRDVARNIGKSGEYFGRVTIIRSGLGLLSFFVTLLLISFGRHDIDVYISLVLVNLTLLFSSVIQVMAAIFTAQEQIERHLVLRVAIFVFQLPFTLIAIFSGAGLIGIFVAFLLAYIIVAIVGILYYHQSLLEGRIDIDWSSMFKLIRYALPYAILFGFYPIFYRLNVIILSLLSDDTAVGWYSKAFSIREIVLLLCIAYETAIFPSLTQQYNHLDRFRQRIFQLLQRFSLVAFLSMAVLLAWGDKTLSLLYGDKPGSPAWEILQVLAYDIPVFYIGHLFRAVIRATDNQWPQVILSVILLGIHLVLSLTLISHWGYMGAGYALLIADTINLVLLLIISFQYWRGINWTRPFIPSLLLAASLFWLLKSFSI